MTTPTITKERRDHPSGQMKVCDECGAEFRRKADTAAGDWERRRFCSVRCSNTQRQRLGALASAGSGPRLPHSAPASQPDEWKRFGACRDHPQRDLWYAHTRTEIDDVNTAKRVCGGCPVSRRCLDYALATGELWGVWGGLDRHQRRALLDRRVSSYPQQE